MICIKQRDGACAGSPVDIADGYIHLSSRSQLAATLDKHIPGIDGLLLAAVDLSQLADTVRWEPARAGPARAPFRPSRARRRHSMAAGYAFRGDQPYALAQAPPISIARSASLSRSVRRNGSTACS